MSLPVRPFYGNLFSSTLYYEILTLTGKSGIDTQAINPVGYPSLLTNNEQGTGSFSSKFPLIFGEMMKYLYTKSNL